MWKLISCSNMMKWNHRFFAVSHWYASKVGESLKTSRVKIEWMNSAWQRWMTCIQNPHLKFLSLHIHSSYEHKLQSRHCIGKCGQWLCYISCDRQEKVKSTMSGSSVPDMHECFTLASTNHHNQTMFELSIIQLFIHSNPNHNSNWIHISHGSNGPLCHTPFCISCVWQCVAYLSMLLSSCPFCSGTNIKNFRQGRELRKKMMSGQLVRYAFIEFLQSAIYFQWMIWFAWICQFYP